MGTWTERRAYRRIGNGLLQNLGVLPGETRSVANGVSGDGNVVVGNAEHTLGAFIPGQAFRWTDATGMQGLGYLRPNGHLSRASGISRDGSTIVGMSQSDGGFGPVEAFRWTAAGGMQALPNLPGSTSISAEAHAVSADGSVVVGDAPSAVGSTHAVRWTALGVEDLGVLPGTLHSNARAVSDDGLIVGGNSGLGTLSLAFVWTPGTGMLDLSGFLSMHGVATPIDHRLRYVYAISGDGLTFAGEALNLITNEREGFMATIPSPATAIVLLVVPVACWRRRRG